jgi:hypothetical protein
MRKAIHKSYQHGGVRKVPASRTLAWELRFYITEEAKRKLVFSILFSIQFSIQLLSSAICHRAQSGIVRNACRGGRGFRGKGSAIQSRPSQISGLLQCQGLIDEMNV